MSGRFRPSLALSALLVTCLGFGFHQWTIAPPEPLQPGIEGQFSAYSAFDLLARLLGDEQPHPTGSTANHRVRDEIVSVLSELGLESEVQRAWGCSSRGSRCAWVENIISSVPGQEEGPYVALMAHYDSVPAAPGAGDDGAGVATLLETARLLSSQPRARWPLLLIFTDAEELGLLGAEAFFEQHYKRDEIGLILNIEGSGSSGPSQVIRTHTPNNAIIEAYRSAPMPSGLSVINEIFKRMPNDTDFSVAMHAGIPGADFAFASERSHYHTPLDRLLSLDLSTLQHHGDNLWPLTKALVNKSSFEGDFDLSYQPVFGWWLTWPESRNGLIIIGVSLILGFVLFRDGALWITLKSGLTSLSVVISVLALTHGLFELLWAWKEAQTSWPAFELPLRVLLVAFPMCLLMLTAGITARQGSLAQRLLAGIFVWWLLGVAFLFTLPAAVNLVIPVLVFGAVLLFLRLWLSSLSFHIGALLLLLISVPQSLGLVIPLEESQGYRLLLAFLPSLGMFLVLLVPFLVCKNRALFVLPFAFLSIAAAVNILVLPLYSADRPQHINFRLVSDPDGEATLGISSRDDLGPTWLESASEREGGQLPWAGRTSDAIIEIESLPLDPPTVRHQSTIMTTAGLEHSLILESPRVGDTLGLVMTDAPSDLRFNLDGQWRSLTAARWGSMKGLRVLTLAGIRGKSISLKLQHREAHLIKGFLFDTQYGLPMDLKHFSEKRGQLAVPTRTGDHSLAYQSFQINP